MHILHVHESHPRQLIYLRKSDCLGCAVLLCLVCLLDLACFLLPSFSSLIKTCTVHIYSSIYYVYLIHCAHVHVYVGSTNGVGTDVAGTGSDCRLPDILDGRSLSFSAGGRLTRTLPNHAGAGMDAIEGLAL